MNLLGRYGCLHEYTFSSLIISRSRTTSVRNCRASAGPLPQAFPEVHVGVSDPQFTPDCFRTDAEHLHLSSGPPVRILS